jgi:2-polyprenyl-3-methyl-5-hydroxy-6-metoxy-1,4-benzoquinol methylase
MQSRHFDNRQYFNELVITGQKFFLPYIDGFIKITEGLKVLEIGCGEGGILLPFARMGCSVVGVDLDSKKIDVATSIFAEEGADGRFIAQDVFKVKELEHEFDLIVCHDVIEHIFEKKEFIAKCELMLKPGGYMFMSFPAWQMPFGGHQQMCKSRLLSHLPWMHLLPRFLYRFILKLFKESQSRINDLMDIKRCKCPIEKFERVVKDTPFSILDRRLYFINPHYETKFHLKPRRLWRWVGAIPYLRDFFTTSCFYMLKLQD